MESLSVSEYRRQFGSIVHMYQACMHVGKRSALAVQSFPPLAATTFRQMNLSQKVLLFSITLGGSAIWFLTKYFKRKRRPLTARSLRGATRRARQMSISSKAGLSSGTGDFNVSSKRCNTSYDWIELQKKAAVIGDKESVTSAATLIDGTPLTPQQLGLMGMEALETVVGYWEDALAAYQPRNGMNHQLTTAEEAAFVKMLENILETAYNLQEESEHMFIYQESILNKSKRKTLSVNFIGINELDGHNGASSSYKTPLLSVSSVDQDSFVSAQDTIADLRDFEDLNEIVGETDAKEKLYLEALEHLEKNGIPYRTIRTDFVGCANDTEYLAKLHCLRLAFKEIMSKPDDRNWWSDNGRQMLAELLVRSDKDPKDFIQVYDELLDYLSEDDEHIEIMAEELKSRNVQCTNFYDICLDYILIDSFEDLESPPSSVIAVMNNRWLSNGFKETALQTAIWSVLKAKRRLLRHSDGFKAQFYNLSEIIIPTLAWGFFGPDENMNTLMCYFRDQVLDFIKGLYDSQCVRFTTIEDLSNDIMNLAKLKFGQTINHLSSLETVDPI